MRTDNLSIPNEADSLCARGTSYAIAPGFPTAGLTFLSVLWLHVAVSAVPSTCDHLYPHSTSSRSLRSTWFGVGLEGKTTDSRERSRLSADAATE